MAVHNDAISGIFNEIADFLELENANPFRIRAYRRAALNVSGMSSSVADMAEEGKDLRELPGIGEDLAEKLKTISRTGTHPFLEKLRKKYPPELPELMRVPGLGPKRLKVLYEALKIGSMRSLEDAARKGKIASLPGFGKKTEESILDGIARVKKLSGKTSLYVAEQILAPLVKYIGRVKGIKKLTVAGSIRRKSDMVKDADILVVSKNGSKVMNAFSRYEEVARVLAKGTTKSSVALRSGFQADLRIVPEESYGSALHYFTGSKAHNIAIRHMALERGLTVNEYGVFSVKKGKKKKVAGKTEEDVYAAVGLPYIEPELREDRGEIQAAAKNKLPKLITLNSIKGDLHAHTTKTDGRNTLEEMARAALGKGYEYFSNNEHSRHVTVANGLTAAELKEHIKYVDKVNKKLKGIRILKSIEVDILSDGSLDLPDDILKELDFTVCAVHYKFNLSEEEQTERILRAMDNPYFNILAHPTGRLLGERPAYDVDMERIIRAAKERGCILELDAHPERLDINDVYCKMAKEHGIKVAISTDAHGVDDFDLMRFGINQARRGWLVEDDVINTRPLKELLKFFRRR